jgi:hypothetical protein
LYRAFLFLLQLRLFFLILSLSFSFIKMGYQLLEICHHAHSTVTFTPNSDIQLSTFNFQSPAALRWLSAPLFIDKSKRATTDSAAAAAQLMEVVAKQQQQQQRQEQEEAAEEEGGEEAAVALAVVAKGSLVRDPTVLKTMKEYKQKEEEKRKERQLVVAVQRQQEEEEEEEEQESEEAEHRTSTPLTAFVDSSSSSSSSFSGVFAPREDACSAEFLETHKKELKKSGGTSRVCLTPQAEKKQRDLHGPQHQSNFPDYIHFVHIPKAGGTSFTKVGGWGVGGASSVFCLDLSCSLPLSTAYESSSLNLLFGSFLLP